MFSRKASGIILVAIIAITAVLVLSGCTTPTPTAAPTGAPTATPSAGPREVLKMATTTSMQDTGLLDYLKSDFDSKYNMDLQWTSVGSGQALALGRSGDVSVLLVHSPKDETTFVNDGYGWNRTQFAHNFYVIVGPSSDPAGIKDLTNASQAFTKIRDSKSKFVSRGDNSGTNAKELSLWNMTGSTPSNITDSSWYVSTGVGMGSTLTMANEMQAYTLSDLSTFIHNQKNLSLVVLVENDPKNLINKYDLIAINHTMYPSSNYNGALKFIEFMTSKETQEKIRDYGKAEFGRPLFYADVLNQTT
ncbi:MAG: PBP superfamily domain protein [Methanocella sp. PtaU1.Bin125]|nr:MAG: PBP superfamily domain protein [Methanocella sp. PtaU1.Bin125]